MSARLGEHLLLWGGNVHERSLEERFEVARAGGFTAMSVSPLDLTRWSQSGISTADLRREAARQGVRIAAVDPLTKWLDGWRPPAGMDAEGIAFGDFETDAVLDMASELGADLVTAVEYTGEPVDPAAATACFGRLCDRALERGVRVGLEPMPFSGIDNLGLAWEIAGGADRANGGLVVDAWHLFRGPRPDEDTELIATIPGERIFSVQFDDAPQRAEVADLREETMHRRLLPGEGAIDLDRFVAQIAASGAAGVAVGPEVFSDELAGLPAAELGAALRRSLAPFLCS